MSHGCVCSVFSRAVWTPVAANSCSIVHENVCKSDAERMHVRDLYDKICSGGEKKNPINDCVLKLEEQINP